MRFRLPLTALLSLWVLGAALPDARATEKEPLALAASVASDRLPQSLSALPERAKVRLDAVPLDAQSSQLVALKLEKFTVFAPDAVVVVDSGSANERRLAPPAMAHFRGEVEGYPGSSAFWSVDESGHMKGILHMGEQIIVTEQPPGSPLKIAAPTSRPVDKSSDFAGRNFQCGVEQTHLLDFFQPSKPGQSKAAPPVAELSNTVYTARIAIETDYEFFQLLGNQTAAAQYIADLIGYVSSTYLAEVKTNLQVGDVYLYSTSSDPWSANTTSTALAEVQAYWLANNRPTVTRTVTHFMSGKGNGQGGIAYVGVLCDGTYGYGVSMSLGGHFSAANPQIVWDSVVIAHEIGHNFGSPHTHEWDTDFGGSPVDCCYRNTASGSVCSTAYGSLPGFGSLTGGTSGSGAGTIMSYCHQLSPGYSNLSFTFGLNHTKGISPARVPTQMRTTVENAAAAAPSCLVAGSTPTTYTLTVNSSGAASVAISASPTTYAGMTNYNKTGIAAGTSLTLTAPAMAGGAPFSHWSGCDSVAGAICSVALSASKTVTASYNSLLGQSIIFGAAPSVVVGGTGSVSATGGGSGLPVIFSSLTTSICTVSGSNGSTVLGVAAGTCNIAANQAGNSSYSAAPQVTQNFSVAPAAARYTKIANNGTALPDSAALGSGPTQWACTRDNTSGLTWEVKTTDGGLRDWNKTYTHYDDPAQAQKWNGSAYVNPAQAEIDAASNSIGLVNAVNASSLCGSADWKMPSWDELRDLVDTAYVPTINPTFFPNTPSAAFWSGSPYAGYPANALAVVFNNGSSFANVRNGNDLHVRLVRSGQSLGTFTLSLSATGSGSGTLTSSPGGLNCASAAGTTSGTCSTPLASGTVVTLTATPATGSTFTGWSGACSGSSATCTLSMAAAKSVTASFNSALASQTITFGAAPSVVVGGTGTLSATGGGSGLPVIFSSLTTSICTVSGSNGSTVLGVAAGTCNIAADQAGNSSTSAAAQITQSFNITALLFGPPTLISIIAGSGSATIHFLPPSNTGGLRISGYTATCTASGQNTRTASGTVSPLTVKSLTGGVLYQCSLAATNSAGLTSTASAALPVTPMPGKKSNLTPILLLLLD